MNNSIIIIPLAMLAIMAVMLIINVPVHPCSSADNEFKTLVGKETMYNGAPVLITSYDCQHDCFVLDNGKAVDIQYVLQQTQWRDEP